MRERMPISDRAKQFMPFAALPGLEILLQEKEKLVLPEPELAPDQEEEVNYKLSKLLPGGEATVIYFSKGEILKVTGIVARIDKASKSLQVVHRIIPFENIISIK